MSDEETESLQNWHDVWGPIAGQSQASVNDSISFSINKSRINLATIYDMVNNINKRVAILEDKLDQVSSDLSLAINTKPITNLPYKPFYNKESHVSSQNFCYLCNDNLTFRIVIMADSDSIVLYPFGKQKISKEYQPWTYPGYLKGNEDEIIGSIDLQLKLHNGIYTLTPDSNLYETEMNEKRLLNDVERPFSITFENKLS